VPPPKKDRSEYNAMREVENLQRVFERLDQKHDKKIDVEELHEYLKFLGLKCNRAEAEDIIWEVDEDHDCALTWEEFKKTYYRVRHDQTGWEPRRLFNVIDFMMHDKDSSGTIDVDECTEIFFRRFGSDMLEEKVKDFMAQDEDGDSDITFTEFLHMDQKNDSLRMRKEPGFRFSQGMVDTTIRENRKLLAAVNMPNRAKQ